MMDVLSRALIAEMATQAPVSTLTQLKVAKN
jgi:hypothetical protein